MRVARYLGLVSFVYLAIWAPSLREENHKFSSEPQSIAIPLHFINLFIFNVLKKNKTIFWWTTWLEGIPH